MLAAICYAADVVMVVASVTSAEVMVAEVIAKLKEVGSTVGAEKTHWTSHPKMMDTSIGVDGLAVLWEKVLEFVGSKTEMQVTSFEFFMGPKSAALERCKNHNVAGFSLECERVDDGQGTKRQNCELECECGGERDLE